MTYLNNSFCHSWPSIEAGQSFILCSSQTATPLPVKHILKTFNVVCYIEEFVGVD